MDLLEIAHTYFRGERSAGIVLGVAGVALCAFSVWIWRTQSGGFAWGLLVPLALVGLVGLAGGPLFVWKTARQVGELDAAYRADAEGTIASERTRMARVDANWPRLKIGWSVIALAALVLLMLVKRDWATGLGLALMLIATLLFFVDVFAERRAVPYTDALARAAADGT